MKKDLKALIVTVVVMVITAIIVNSEVYGETNFTKMANIVDEVATHKSLRVEDLVKDHQLIKEVEEQFESQPEAVKMHKNMDEHILVDDVEVFHTYMRIILAKRAELDRRMKAQKIVMDVVDPVLSLPAKLFFKGEYIDENTRSN